MTDHQVRDSTGYDDDDFVPPVARRAASRIQICPACSKPIAKHGVMELLECAEAAEEQAESARDWYMVQTRIAHEAKVKQAIEARVDDIEVIINKQIPGYVLVRCELDHETWQSIKRVDDVKNFVAPNGVGRPSPLPQVEVDKFLSAAEPPPPPPKPEGAIDFEVFQRKRPATVKRADREAAFDAELFGRSSAELEEERTAKKVVLPAGELDYEELAAAMKVVLEKERDDIIKRGGPIEKINIELKQKLADAFEQIALWRRRAQSNAEARNSLQAQLDEQVKANRKLRNELKGRKESNHVHLNEIVDILAVVDKTKGWTKEKGGTGHWQIYKNGVWISDAAGSGGSTRVNQATRVKLRKAGLEV